MPKADTLIYSVLIVLGLRAPAWVTFRNTDAEILARKGDLHWSSKGARPTAYLESRRRSSPGGAFCTIHNDLAFGSILPQTEAGRLGMFWRNTKPPQAVETATTFQEVSGSPEADISQAIVAYQRAFADTLRRSVNTNVENAKQLVARAPVFHVTFGAS